MVCQTLAEITQGSSERIVAYRGTYRWVQSYEPVEPPAQPAGFSRLRKQGVYLITGGLGNIGLALAAYLATTVQAKPVLTGRSASPPRDRWEDWLSTHDQADEI